MFLFQKGQTIDNRYAVVFPHKEGDYAETYRVRDASGKLRFLKLIYYSKLQYSQFDKDGSIIEVEVAKTLNHPRSAQGDACSCKNVCKYVDSGTLIANGQQLAYIVTEFVSGETLDKRIAREDLSIYEIKQVAKALLVWYISCLYTKNVPLGTLFLWEAGGICRCKDRRFSFNFQVF